MFYALLNFHNIKGNSWLTSQKWKGDIYNFQGLADFVVMWTTLT